MSGVRITAMGECGVLFECLGEVVLEKQERLWTLSDTIRAEVGVTEAICGMGNLLVLFDPGRASPERVGEALRKAWSAARPAKRKAAQIDIPVHYGGPGGPDLPLVAHFAGLTERETAKTHAGGRYVVFAIGSSPGFGYLAGLPDRIAIPRRKVPILRAEKGSVAIGGPQTGVTSAAGPTGWHVIGSSELALFDLARNPPALLAPGDIVRFRCVGVGR